MGRNKGSVNKGNVYKNCLGCNKLCHVSPYRKETWKYCTRECQRVNSIHKISLVCLYCKNSFIHYKHDLKNGRKFCSWECSNRGKKINTGQNNGNWKGGVVENYRKDRTRFSRSIRLQIFERDNYTCKLCNTRGTILHVDHIKSFAKYPKERFSQSNCQTLCQKCHYRKTYNREIPEKSAWGLGIKELR